MFDTVWAFVDDPGVRYVLLGFSSTGQNDVVGAAPPYNAQYIAITRLLDYTNMLPIQHDVATTVNAGIPVMLYTGLNDLVECSAGAQFWLDQFAPCQNSKLGKGWSPDATRHRYFVDGLQVGFFQSCGHFTWAGVQDAGHMVPYDRPRAAEQLFFDFTAGAFTRDPAPHHPPLPTPAPSATPAPSVVPPPPQPTTPKPSLTPPKPTLW